MPSEYDISLNIRNNRNYTQTFNGMGGSVNPLDTSNATTEYRYNITTFNFTDENAVTIYYKAVGSAAFSSYTADLPSQTPEGLVIALNGLGIGFFNTYVELGQTYVGTYNENYIFGSLDVYNPSVATTTTTSTTTTTTTLAAVEFAIGYFCGTTTPGLADILVDNFSGGSGSYQINTQVYATENAALNGTFSNGTTRTFINNADGTYWVAIRDANNTSNVHANQISTLCSTTTTTTSTTTSTTTLAPTTTTTTSTTTTIGPLDFTISYTCDIVSIGLNADTPTGGTGSYQFGSTFYLSQAAALLNTSWITSTSISYGVGASNNTFWVVMRDSVGTLLAKSITTACTTTTSTTTSTTTAAPTTSTTTSTTTLAPTTTTSTTTSTTTNLVYTTFAVGYDASVPSLACENYNLSPIVAYSTAGAVLANGTTLYTNTSLTTLVPAGYYANNGKYWVASSGVLSGESICVIPTTTTTTTLAPTTTTTTSTTSTTTTQAPVSVQVGSTAVDACYAPTLIATVTYNSATFCTSTTLTSGAFVTLADGNYYVSYLGQTLNMNIAGSPTTIGTITGGGCQTCPATTTTTTTTSTTSTTTTLPPTTTTTTSTTTTIQPVSFTISQSCSLGTAIITIDNFAGGTSGLYQVNTQVYTSEANAIAGSFINASAPYQYTSVPDGTWYVCVRDRSNNIYLATNSIATNCATTTTTTTSTTSTTTTQAPVSVTVGVSAFEACYLPIQTATATFNTATFCTATTLTSASFATLGNGNYYVQYLGNTINMSISGAPTTTGTIFSGGCQSCPATTTTTTTTSTTTTTTTQAAISVKVASTAVGACYAPLITANANPNTGNFCTTTTLTSSSFTTLSNGNYFVSYLGQTINMNIAGAPTTIGTIFSGGCQTCPATTTTSTSTTTTTLAPVAYTIDNGANGSAYGACTGSTTTTIVYAAPGNTTPIVGLILYNNQNLTSPFVGGAGYRKLVNPSATSYAAVVDGSGQITNYSACASVTTTTSTTTTTTTSAPVPYTIDNGGNGNPYGACTGSVPTSTVYAAPGNTVPIVGLILYTNQNLTSPFVGGGGYRKLVSVSATSYAAVVDTSGQITSYSACSSITTTTTSTTTTTTTLPPTTTTTSTTSTTTTNFTYAYVNIVNTFFSGQITDVQINGQTPAGIVFPVDAGNNASGTTTQLGTQTIRIFYSSVLAGSNIQYDDGIGPINCQNVGGNGSITWNGAEVTELGTISINPADGSCP